MPIRESGMGMSGPAPSRCQGHLPGSRPSSSSTRRPAPSTPNRSGQCRTGLTTAMAGSASIVVTHRLSTVRNADHILVLDADRFVERGTHNELSSPGEASTSS
jgi:hypothetical protein